MLLAGGCWGVLVELAQRHEPHRAACQVDADVVAAAFFGPADEGGLDAGRAEVAGDEVVHDVCRGEGRSVGGSFFFGEPRYAQCLHVEAGAVGPWPVVAVAARRGVDDAGAALCEFLWG